MNLVYMLEIMRAVRIIFENGIKPVAEDFKEFTSDLYQAFAAADLKVDDSARLYAWVPTKLAYETRFVLTLTEEHKDLLLAAADQIEELAMYSGLKFADYVEKLRYVARLFPDVLSDETMFARVGNQCRGGLSLVVAEQDSDLAKI